MFMAPVQLMYTGERSVPGEENDAVEDCRAESMSANAKGFCATLQH